jgi:hypothetical protein
MLKNILNLEGAQKLTKNEQKSIWGGDMPPSCYDPETEMYSCPLRVGRTWICVYC